VWVRLPPAASRLSDADRPDSPANQRYRAVAGTECAGARVPIGYQSRTPKPAPRRDHGGMPLRPCLVCGRLSSDGRCPGHYRRRGRPDVDQERKTASGWQCSRQPSGSASGSRTGDAASSDRTWRRTTSSCSATRAARTRGRAWRCVVGIIGKLSVQQPSSVSACGSRVCPSPRRDDGVDDDDAQSEQPDAHDQLQRGSEEIPAGLHRVVLEAGRQRPVGGWRADRPQPSRSTARRPSRRRCCPTPCSGVVPGWGDLVRWSSPGRVLSGRRRSHTLCLLRGRGCHRSHIPRLTEASRWPRSSFSQLSLWPRRLFYSRDSGLDRTRTRLGRRRARIL
jgi:hypothetical protein